MAKAGRPKKGSAGLPAWFNIEKYRDGKTHGTAGWFQQLAFRNLLEDFALRDTPWPYCTEWLALMRADPTITLDRVEAASATEPSGGLERDVARAMKIMMQNAMSLDPDYGRGVRPITCGEVETAYYTTNLKHRIILGFGKRSQPNKQDIRKEWLAERKKPYRGNSCGRNGYIKYVRVDLSLPAPLLKRDFTEFIKSHSKDTQELQGPFFKSQDFSAWYNSGVLPYLDLRLWELETGQSFRWSDFVAALNAITDKPVGGEDACRKTVKSLAKKLLDERTIRMLKFQAVKEMAGSHKKSGKLFVK